MSDFFTKNIVGDGIARGVGESVGRAAAPYLEAPSAILSRPEPSSAMAGAPSFPLPAKKTPAQVSGAMPSAMPEEGDGGMAPSQLSAAGLEFGTLEMASPESVYKATSYAQSRTGQFTDRLFGMTPKYNPATGTMTTTAPNLSMMGFGLASPFVGAVSGYIQSRQKEAALNAAAGKQNNGLITLNGQTIAVVDGKIYGNLPENVARKTVKSEILKYVNSLSPASKSGAQAAQATQEASFDRGGDGGGQAGSGTTKSDWGGGGASAYGEAGRGAVGYYADGGAVQDTGFVEGPPQNYSKGMTVADTVNTQVREGSFILNAPATERLQAAGMLPKETSKVSAAKGGKMVDVALSKGEYAIDVDDVDKYGGYSFLNEVNDKGKPEVDRRQAANSGGFINGYNEGGDVGEDIPMDLPDIPKETLEKFKQFGIKKQKRPDIKQFIRGLSDKEAMALLLLTETSSTADPLESMEAIGEVVVNRAQSTYRDFKDTNNVKDVLLKQTKRGAFQFSGLEPTTLYNRLSEVRKGLAGEGLRKTFAAAENVLSEDPDRAAARRLPSQTLFYTKASAPSQWMRESKDLEYATEIGGHEFYRTFASPEFP